MSYRIIYDKPAVKFLKRQPKETQERIISAIHNLPGTGDIKPLAGHANTFRLRVGSYRVISSVGNNVVNGRVLDIGNRGDVYK